MTITIGWWLLPALITIGAFVWASWTSAKGNGGGDYNFNPLPLFFFPMAAIISLVSWLVYFIVN